MYNQSRYFAHISQEPPLSAVAGPRIRATIAPAARPREGPPVDGEELIAVEDLVGVEGERGARQGKREQESERARQREKERARE